MTTQPQPEPTLRDLANKLDQLTADVDQRFDALSREMERSNDKFDAYQKGTQWGSAVGLYSHRQRYHHRHSDHSV